MRHDLDVPLVDKPINVRNRSAQSVRRFGYIQKLVTRDDPEAKFVVPQPRVEVRNQNVEQVLLRFVENGEVRSPRHASYRWEASVR